MTDLTPRAELGLTGRPLNGRCSCCEAPLHACMCWATVMTDANGITTSKSCAEEHAKRRRGRAITAEIEATPVEYQRTLCAVKQIEAGELRPRD